MIYNEEITREREARESHKRPNPVVDPTTRDKKDALLPCLFPAENIARE